MNRERGFSKEWVLYQTSEDRHLSYKSYIEDILLGMVIQGAKLVPSFRLFRAHHNKVFMVILRDLSPNGKIKNIRSKTFGVLEDFLNYAPATPFVIKPSEGATWLWSTVTGRGGSSPGRLAGPSILSTVLRI